MVPPITTSININADPEAVRKVFFDFSSYPLWSRSASLTLSLPPPRASSSTSSSQSQPLTPGSKIVMEADGIKMTPTVIKNTPSEFVWEGGLWPLLKAQHTFHFRRAEQGARTTTVLVQEERFWGLLAFLFAGWWPSWLGGIRTKTQERFVRWNGEFKGWVEGEGRRD